MHPEAQKLIEDLRLQSHPEGGWFRETYRSGWEIPVPALPPGYDGPRALGTSILFLLAGDAVSRLHRLRGDEMWFHHAGGGLHLHLFWPAGPDTSFARHEELQLGLDGNRGQTPQVLVPGGCWFGATLADDGTGDDGYALVGCSMAPGFDFADFALARPEVLRAAFPAERELIARLA
ncbi:MAG: cupin domain-containing protein [Candidatus Krumholzibacteriia bacterium]